MLRIYVGILVADRWTGGLSSATTATTTRRLLLLEEVGTQLCFSEMGGPHRGGGLIEEGGGGVEGVGFIIQMVEVLNVEVGIVDGVVVHREAAGLLLLLAVPTAGVDDDLAGGADGVDGLEEDDVREGTQRVRRQGRADPFRDGAAAAVVVVV